MQESETVGDKSLVRRDSNGRLSKGSRLNPHGGTERKLLIMKRKLDGLTERAIARLGQLINSENEAVALGSIKEVLDRNLGKAKATLQVDVTHTSVIHLQALEEIAERKRNQLLTASQHDIGGQDESGSIIHIMRSAVQHNEGVTIDNVDYAVEPPAPGPPPGAAAVAPPHIQTDEKI
jgi:hypothetical protein